MHLLQATEMGPFKGKEGPCTLYLKNMVCQYEDFVHWFAESDWLLRSATRVYPVSYTHLTLPTKA